MIAARDLVHRHGQREVLRGLTLEVARGEIAAVIGPSGGGKSTFLRCLNGLDRFQAGEVTVGDLRLGPEVDARRDAELLRRVRRRVGFVFHQFHLFPHRTVLGNVIEAPIHVLGLERERAVERARGLLERVGLGAELDRLPRQLSGGQQQRVAIARALAMEPEALLLDEPTSALDPVMAGEVLAVLADLARSGQTMIVVTHAMHFARQVASRVHVFAEGRVVESGPPNVVLETPQHAVTRAFLQEETRR